MAWVIRPLHDDADSVYVDRVRWKKCVQVAVLTPAPVGQGNRGFAKSRLQRGVKFRPFQGRNETATDRQRHEFAGREAQCRNVAKPREEFPSHLPLHTFRHESPADRFNGRKVSAKGSRMARSGRVYRLGELTECESVA